MAAALWTASTLMNPFYNLDDAQPAHADAMAAGISGGEDGAMSQGEEEDVADLVHLRYTKGGDGGDGRLDGRRHIGGPVPGYEEILRDSDGGLLAQVEVWLHVLL